jgi:uncharacterized protein YciI
MSKNFREIRDLTAGSLRRKVCVAFSHPTASEEDMLPHLAEHLRYMIDREAEILLSGPIVGDGQLVGESITVFRDANDVKAAEFMRHEPLVRRGLRRFDIKTWELREGSLNLVTRLSESRFTFQ